MSKWNKPGREPSEQFLQNEERRRQMIIDAARRRRDKEKKLQELNEDIKKKEQEALVRHKQEKKEVYTKYLRNNMHDKYEYKKRMEKMEEQTVKDVSKWRRRGRSEEKGVEQPSRTAGQAQSKETGLDKNDGLKKVQQKVDPAKQALKAEYEKEWGEAQDREEEDLISSQLLDSLDLDFNTIQRCQNINSQLKDRIEAEKENKLNPANEDLNQIKQIIGYESMLAGDSMMDLQSEIASRKNTSKIDTPASHQPHSKFREDKKKKQKQANQQETFNSLKHQKGGKILEWAGSEVEEADDLFSHCSSQKKIVSIPEIGNKISSKKLLEPIPEQQLSKKSVEKALTNSAKARNEKPGGKVRANAKVPSAQGQDWRKEEKPRSIERKTSLDRKGTRKPTMHAPSRSQEKKTTTSQSQEDFNKRKEPGERKVSGKTQQSFKVQKNPPLPAVPRPCESVATHQQFFDIDSFIKHDLNTLNEEERRVQEQIREIHMSSKGRLRQVEQKYDIKTDLKKTDNLLRHLHGETVENEGYSRPPVALKSEHDIEDSIERLDDLLIRRDLQSRETSLTHVTEESHLRSETASIIDPLGRPEDLQMQVLKLAENISRFEEAPPDNAPGYGYNQRAMKKKEVLMQGLAERERASTKQDQGCTNLSNPPILKYSSNIAPAQPSNESVFKDSLDTMQKGVIKVNQNLKNLLFD